MHWCFTSTSTSTSLCSSIHKLLLWHLQVQQLISELNEILAHDVVDEGGLWKKKLPSQSLQLFEFLPQAIQEQLMLERDPHGNVQVLLVLYMIFDQSGVFVAINSYFTCVLCNQVARIETEKMLIQMVETELEKRKQEGAYNAQFKGQSHFFGYSYSFPYKISSFQITISKLIFCLDRGSWCCCMWFGH